MNFFDQKSLFPFLDELTTNIPLIEEELKRGDWYNWPEKSLWDKPGYEWQVCPLFGFGIWRDDKMFPKLIPLLKKIPGIKTALFSRLSAGTKLKPHQGWASLANTVLRCHLGLIVPTDGKSGIIVAGEFQQINQGKWLVFDDSKTHSGINEGSTDKLILLVDIERPSHIPRGKSQVGNSKELINFVNSIKQLNAQSK
jgi:aspartyl/asparaginyl beta-hydroxylase (cupin superfamily)